MSVLCLLISLVLDFPVKIESIPPFAPRPVMVNVDQQPPCVHLERTSLHFPGDSTALYSFYWKLEKLLLGGEGNVNVWHVGGSHVQAGYFPSRMQNNLTGMAPGMKGERGVLFPYRMNRTNYDKSYHVNWTGEWTASKSVRPSKKLKVELDYGITGYSAITTAQNASVSLNMNISKDTLWTFDRVKVYGYGSEDEVYPYICNGCDTLTCARDDASGTWTFDLGIQKDSVDIMFNVPKGASFVLEGIEPLSGRKGVSYYASGVNGAHLATWLDRCNDLERDLQAVSPDLVIFGLGINDSSCSPQKFDPEHFKDNYRRMISLVHRVSPDCAIIFITNNDSYRYVRRGMTHNDNGEAVRQAMYELAGECGAAVWDLFDIMGGNNSVLEWKEAGLIRKDKLHFTKDGYVLLGDLLYNSIVRNYRQYLLNTMFKRF